MGGPTRKTLVAAAGTVAGVVMAGVAASLFSLATGITGWNVSDIESLHDPLEHRGHPGGRAAVLRAF